MMGPRRLCLVVCIGLLQFPAAAQDEQGEDRPPTLDELLGVEGGSDESGGGADLPTDAGDEELERLLSGAEIADEFREAVDLMGRSATRIGLGRDTGITTQRMQEDAIRKLDKLIADAERRSEQGGSSQSSSSQQQQQQQQASQPDQRQAQQAGDRENRGEAEPPGGQSGALRPEQLADLAAWGALPERFREALVQGSSDKFSATYRRLTESYYKMLAEEREP